MTPSEVEKEFEKWGGECSCQLGWNSEGKRCVIYFDKNCPFHYPDSELAKLKEAHSRQQEKIEKLKAGLSDLINTIEFLNPFGSGHPNIKLRVQLDTLKKLLDET